MKGLARKQPTADGETKVLRDYLQQFSGVPLLDGRLLSGLMLAGATSAALTHPLDRAYRGALQTSGALSVRASDPVNAPDASKQVLVECDVAPIADLAFTLWVF